MALGGAHPFLRRLRLEPGPPLTMLALVAATVAVVGVCRRRADLNSALRPENVCNLRHVNMIGRLSLITIAGVAVIALTSALAAPAASDANRLTVKTGPGLTMKLTRAGREIDYLRPGRHAITIRDTSRSHNVALTRFRGTDWRGTHRDPPKVLTSFSFVGTKTVTVALTPGLYSVSCLRHTSPGPPAVGSRDQGMTDPFRVQ